MGALPRRRQRALAAARLSGANAARCRGIAVPICYSSPSMGFAPFQNRLAKSPRRPRDDLRGARRSRRDRLRDARAAGGLRPRRDRDPPRHSAPDNMGVVRILDGQWAVLHATTVPCGCDGEDGAGGDCFDPEPLASPGRPRLRPRPARFRASSDAVAELNPDFPVDAFLIEKGVRSSIWEPFRMGDQFSGGVWASSFPDRRLQRRHQEMLRPIAALLGSAVEHWRIWDAERRRRERLEQLEERLGSLSESLDVRQIFARISDGLQPILPHDLLVLTELDAQRRTLRILASAGRPTSPFPRNRCRSPTASSSTRAREGDRARPPHRARRQERARALSSPPACGPGCGCRCGPATSCTAAGHLLPRTGALPRRDVEVAERLADRVGRCSRTRGWPRRRGSPTRRAPAPPAWKRRCRPSNASSRRAGAGGSSGVAVVARGPGAGRPRRLLRDHGAGHRRVGHRRRSSPAWVHEGCAGRPDRWWRSTARALPSSCSNRALRPREGAFTGALQTRDRPPRAGGRRNALPRRGSAR